MRPDFGLLLADSCVFRGEEKKETDNGNRNEAKDELKYNTRWVYDPAPYILGW